jgi:hypothetical protein
MSNLAIYLGGVAMEKFSVTKSLLFLFLGLFIFPACAAAKDAKSPIQFGRYNLLQGQNNPVCLAVGEQIKDYQRVPFVPNPKRSSFHYGVVQDVDKFDVRCDAPIHSTNQIKVLNWQPIDTLKRGQDARLAAELYSDFYPNRNLGDAVRKEKFRPEYEMDSQRGLLELATAEGLIEFQKSEISMNGLGTLPIYRFSLPLNPRNSKCWNVGFDRKSPLNKLRHLDYPININEVFSYGTENYFNIAYPSQIAAVVTVYSLDSYKDQDAGSLLTFSENHPVVCEFFSKEAK